MINETANKPAKLLRMVDVRERTGLSRSFIYELVKKGTFPRPFKLATRASVWVESEVNEWIENKIANRGGQ